MSVKVMSRVWEESTKRGAELLVLLALADWSNDRGESDPSNAQLAKKARVDKRRVKRILDLLESEGELVRRRGKGFRFGKKMVSNKTILVKYVGVSAPPG